MALDQAIYEPNTGFIYGVRGQWVLKYNPADGTLVDSKRFTTRATYFSTITAMAGKLYCGVLFTPIADYSNGADTLRDIFVVDAASFTVTGALGIGTTQFNTTNNAIASCWKSAINDGTHLAAWNNGTFGALNIFGIVQFDPAVLPGSLKNAGFNFCDDICYDSFNNVYWMADSAGAFIWLMNTYNITVGVTTAHNTNFHDTIGIHGITYNNATNKVYVVNASAFLSKVNAADAFPGPVNFPVTTGLNTGRINANPCRIKSVNNQVGNPHNGKVLVPTWNDDAVVIWNPLTDTVDSVQTGFTAPMDIVVCPTTNWAVQTGSVSLKQIT